MAAVLRNYIGFRKQKGDSAIPDSRSIEEEQTKVQKTERGTALQQRTRGAVDDSAGPLQATLSTESVGAALD